MPPRMMPALKKKAPAGALLAAERARRDVAAQQSGLVIPLSEWLGHNNGPPITGEAAYLGYVWRKAYADAWSEPNMDIVRRRARRAAAIGLSYHDYVLEILERGRYL